jgi:hypothetical protein
MHGALGTSLRWLAVAQIEELAGLGQVAHNADPDRVAEAIGSFLG